MKAAARVSRGGLVTPESIYGGKLLMHVRSVDVNAGATNGTAITSLKDIVSGATFSLVAGIGGFTNVWPTYVTNQLNGFPILRFSATGLEATNAWLSGSTDCALHVVIKQNNATGLVFAAGPQPLSGDGFTSNTGSFQLATLGSSATHEGASGTGSVHTASAVTDYTSFHVVTFQRTGTTIQTTADASTTAGSTAATYPNANVGHAFLGVRYNDTTTPLPWSGDIAEWCLVKGTADIVRYRQYTLTRYGI